MRFKLIFVFILVFGKFVSNAQTQFKSFTQDTGVYIKELGEFMRENKNEEAIATYKQFLIEWNRPIFSEEQKRFMVRISNKMLIAKMRENTEFVSLLKALSSYSRKSKGEAIFVNWQRIVEKTLIENKKSFKDFLDFTANLFEDNVIYTNNLRNWQCNSSEYELKFDGEPFIYFPKTSIKCYANGGSGTISNTSRITEAMKGKIIIAKINPAQRIPIPLKAPENKIPRPGICPNVPANAG